MRPILLRSWNRNSICSGCCGDLHSCPTRRASDPICPPVPSPNPIRRRGDIWFGPELPADRTPYVVLQIVPAPAPSIYLRDGERLPQLVMPAAEEVRRAVASLQTGAAAYECGQWLGELPAARRIGLLDRLLVERLDRKCRDVMRLFDACGGDWSQTLYAMLFRALGGNRNREAYLDLASRATYPMVLRERSSMEQVEALLLGTSGLLEGCFYDDYIRRRTWG